MQDRRVVREALRSETPIEVAGEERFDPSRRCARRCPSRGRRAAARQGGEPQDPEAGAEALLGVGALVENEVAQRTEPRPNRGGVPAHVSMVQPA